MTTPITSRLCALAATLLLSAAAFAHSSSVGNLKIGHPYAPPSLAGTTRGVAYLASLENSGTQPERLLRASTPAAARVELHDMTVDAKGVMRMREIDAIVIPPNKAVRMRPGQGMHLMLIDLKQPLKEGASFPMTLEFERAGKVEVSVVVEVPKP